MEHRDLLIEPWADYELIDSGDNRKLERFGKYIVIRPETQALWRPSHAAAWQRADAEFRFGEGGKGGSWRKKNKTMPDTWVMSWHDLRFEARLTSFKHTGVFPEQAANWEWIARHAHAHGANPKVLNLFGYTGIASLAAAAHGAQVTHVDASKQSNTWGHTNADLSGIRDGIRWITDDALKFVEREARRDAEYEGIILDPPAFGRGAKGEVWHIEEHLPYLLAALAKIFSPKPGSFFLLNGYAAGYSPRSFLQAAQNLFAENAQPSKENSYGELQIKESSSNRVVPSGIYTRFTR